MIVMKGRDYNGVKFGVKRGHLRLCENDKAIEKQAFVGPMLTPSSAKVFLQ